MRNPEQQPTELQIEAESKTEKIETTREAAEMVKEKLHGLEIGSLPPKLEARLKQVRLMDKDGVLNIEEIEKDCFSASITIGMAESDLKGLVKREKSIRYLLESQTDKWLTREILSSAAFSSLKKQMNLRKSKLKCLMKPKTVFPSKLNKEPLWKKLQ